MSLTVDRWKEHARAALSRIGEGRGAGALTSAALHAVLLAFAFTAPVNLYRLPGDEGGAPGGVVGVRLYTVAGENATTDAPLNEPLIGEGVDGADGAAGASDASGAEDGEGAAGGGAEAGDGSGTQTAPAGPDAAEAPPPDAETEDPPAPDDTEDPPAPDDTDAEIDAPPESPPVLAAPGGEGAPVENPVQPEAEPAPDRTPAPEPSRVGPTGSDRGDAVITTDGRGNTISVPRARAPTFDEIARRAQNPITPRNFTIQELEGLVEMAVRESFCLSSSDANREVGDCGDAPNALSAELARFGLQRLGESYPTFLEDLSRVEFELQQLGANPSAVDRILTGLREARREAIDTPTLLRRFEGDEAARSTDNFGIDPLPNSAPDPSDGG